MQETAHEIIDAIFPLNKFALYLTRDKDRADDLVQDTLLSILELAKRKGSLDHISGNPVPYFKGMMKYLFLKQKNKDYKYSADSFEDWHKADYPSQFIRIVAQDIETVVNEKRQDNADIVRKHLLGFSPDQIARNVCGFKLPINSVRHEISKFRQEVRRQFA